VQLEELSEQYLIFIVETTRVSSVISAQGGYTLMSQTLRLHFGHQNDSMIYFLSPIVYLLYALISRVH